MGDFEIWDISIRIEARKENHIFARDSFKEVIGEEFLLLLP